MIVIVIYDFIVHIQHIWNDVWICDFEKHFLNINILQVGENPKYLEKPADNNKYNHCIEDILDFTIHGDVIVDDVQNYTCNN